MRVIFYQGKKLATVEVYQACPGCGHTDKLVMHDCVKSYMHNRKVYALGCNCGWMGPEADNPPMAAIKWDARAMINVGHPENGQVTTFERSNV